MQKLRFDSKSGMKYKLGGTERARLRGSDIQTREHKRQSSTSDNNPKNNTTSNSLYSVNESLLALFSSRVSISASPKLGRFARLGGDSMMSNPGRRVAPDPIAERDNLPSNVAMDSEKRDEGVVALVGEVVALCRAEVEVGAVRFSKGGGVMGREEGGREVVAIERGLTEGLVFSLG